MEGEGSFKVKGRNVAADGGKSSPLFRAQPRRFGLYGLRAENRLVFDEASMAGDLVIALRSHVCLPVLLLRNERRPRFWPLPAVSHGRRGGISPPRILS